MDYLILGNGDYARMMRRYLKNTKDIDAVAYTVDGEVIKDSVIDGIPVISAEKIRDKYDPKNALLVMGIGYRNMNQIKEHEFLRYKEMGYSFYNYIHPTAIIDGDVVLGEANNIFEGVIIQEGVKIGDANLIYGGAFIAHENEVGSFNSFSVKSCVAGCTVIGNNCFIGANATVRDHVKLSDYTLVGAGAYLATSTSAYDTIASGKGVLLEGRKSVEFI